jgi:hypothetical protein
MKWFIKDNLTRDFHSHIIPMIYRLKFPGYFHLGMNNFDMKIKE